MSDFRLVPFERRHANAVRECALAAWNVTYRDIFTPTRIMDLVAHFYSDESNDRAEDLISRGLLQYTLALDKAESVIGFQSSTINMLNAELTRIYVNPEHIGTGLGKALLNDAETFFRFNGFKSFIVKVHRYNVVGQRFYDRNEFEFVAEDNDHHLILKKKLSRLPV